MATIKASLALACPLARVTAATTWWGRSGASALLRASNYQPPQFSPSLNRFGRFWVRLGLMLPTLWVGVKERDSHVKV